MSDLVCPGCGLTHGDSRLVELPDGRVVGNYSNAYRLYCEAKWVLKNKRTKNTRRKFQYYKDLVGKVIDCRIVEEGD